MVDGGQGQTREAEPAAVRSKPDGADEGTFYLRTSVGRQSLVLLLLAAMELRGKICRETVIPD